MAAKTVVNKDTASQGKALHSPKGDAGGFDAIDRAAQVPTAGENLSQVEQTEIERRQRAARLNAALARTVCIHCGTKGRWKSDGGVEAVDNLKVYTYRCMGCSRPSQIAV